MCHTERVFEIPARTPVRALRSRPVQRPANALGESMLSPHTKVDSTKRFSNPDGLLRAGHVYLETASRQVRLLNEAARQLHQEGVPFVPADLEKSTLQTPEGKRAEAGDLPLVKAWRERRTLDAVFVLTQTGGKVDHVRWIVSPMLGAGGEVVAVYGTVLVGPPEPDWQVLAGLAHDLRTPLQAMQLFAAIMEAEELSPQARDVSESMRSAAERASAIARDLLEWCRSPSQGRRPERAVFPLAPFLTALV